MHRKGVLIIGILCGVICVAAVFLYTQSVAAETEKARAELLAQYGGDQVEVVVALRTIAPGETITAADVTSKMWIAELLPTGALQNKQDVIGKTTTSAILAGEVVSSNRFLKSTASIEVPDGMVAVTVPVTTTTSVGGSLSAGALVDLYVVTDMETYLLGQKWQVLATSAEVNTTSSIGKSGWITLALKPENTAEVIAAAEKYTLYFTLPGAELVMPEGFDKQVQEGEGDGKGDGDGDGTLKFDSGAGADTGTGTGTGAGTGSGTDVGSGSGSGSGSDSGSGSGTSSGSGGTGKNYISIDDIIKGGLGD